ncbi:MAG: S9 family peptidase [Solobacterium sp.]|nr:S9 family peptidase [Solobacterium sp.]
MKQKPVEIRDLLDFRYPENLQYSPEGTYLAFQTAKAEEEKNTYHRDVWVVKDGTPRQLTAAASTSIVMWDDDTHLIVSRPSPDAEPGVTQLYKIDVNGGEAQEWIVLPFPMSGMKKVKDGLYAVTGMIDKNDPDAYRDNAETRKKKAEEAKKEADYQVVDEVPFWFNGAGFTNGKRTALFTAKTGEKLKVRRLTAPLFDVSEFIVDGEDIWYAGNTKDRTNSLYTKVYVYHTGTKKKETVYGKNTHSIGGLMRMNGRLFVQASDMKEYGVNETAKICEIRDGKVREIRKPERSLYSAVAGDTMLGGGKGSVVRNDVFYTLATDEDHTVLWKYDTAFNKEVLYDQPGAVFFLDVSDKAIAFARETADSLGEIFEMNLDGTDIRQITSMNADVLKDKYVAMPQRIDYTSEGETLHGWVLPPKDFNEKKTYPAVLDIHGGPRAVYGEIFFHEMQVWASKGYFVFFTNIRGSDGRGDAFADIRGKYGYVDFMNLMHFTDAVLKAYPNIDPKRVCETGGSYGGFMTNWIITHTDRFCCAASQRSISNWISMSLISDIGPYFGPDQCGAAGLFGAANIEELWKHSPLRRAEGVKTPTLFIHSDEDYRCPLPEGIQMMQALAVQNVETRLVIFHGENHELSRSGKPAHRIRRLKEITDWFDRHTAVK